MRFKQSDFSKRSRIGSFCEKKFMEVPKNTLEFFKNRWRLRFCRRLGLQLLDFSTVQKPGILKEISCVHWMKVLIFIKNAKSGRFAVECD